MLTCRELVQKVASQGDQALSFSERLSLRVHLMMCGDCRQYLAQLQTIGAVSRERWEITSEDMLAVERIRVSVLKMLSGSKG